MLTLAPAIQGRLVSPNELSTFSAPSVAFALIAFIVVGGALLTITRKNPVAAVMSLVATFFGLAAAYALLYAHFLAALQVLVYAGAIMVLFIFVVMVLNREETDAVASRGILVKVGGAVAVGYTGYQLARYLGNVTAVHQDAPPDSFGTVAEVGTLLFTDYLFAFEAVSILLLIAVIAAVVVARTHKQAAEAEAHDAEDKAFHAKAVAAAPHHGGPTDGGGHH